MRIVAGTARSLTIDAPAGKITRPTSDRVREAIFNSLGSMGLIDGAAIVDLFSGSGALGIEALSRGATRATFVESNRGAASVIQTNIDRCGFTADARVEVCPVERFLDSTGGIRHFDVALIDPPYSFDGWLDLFALLDADTIVVESDRVVEIPSQWDVVRERTYGSTVVQIGTRSNSSTASTGEEQM